MSEKSTLNTIIEGISDNLLLLLAAALAVAGLMQSSGIEAFPRLESPISGEMAVTILLVIAVAGYWAGDKIDGMLPEDEGIYLVVMTDTEIGGGEVHELTEDEWADLTVHGGELFPWRDSPKRVYECIAYDADRNVAVGGWVETKPASAVRAEATVEDVLAAIRELREDLEPDAAKARELQRRFRGVIRRLDRERAEAQQAALDEHIAPSIGDSATISEVVEDMLPSDLHPETMDADLDETVARRSDGHPENDTVSFDLLDDSDDALDPVAADGGTTDE